jgi:hypothetical protein
MYDVVNKHGPTLEIGGVLESGVVPVQPPEPVVEVWEIVSDYLLAGDKGSQEILTHSVVALEVNVVDWIISDDGGEEPTGQLLPKRHRKRGLT